jgi:sporulation protein YlmC with PRC-barrel domain
MQLLSESLARLLLVLPLISHCKMEKTMKYGYRYTAVAAIAALVCGAANAQSPVRSDDAARDAASDYADSLGYEEYLADKDLRATELVGKSVRNADGEELGEIQELVIPSEDADDMLLIVSIGGFLNIGSKLVALPYEELRVSRDGEAFFVNRTQEQLEAAPAFSYETQAEEGQVAAAQREPERAQQRSERQRQTTTDRGGSATTSPSTPDRSPPSRSSGIAAANENERTSAEKTLAKSDHRASTIIGATVLDSAGEEIGEIDDLVVSAENEEVQAVISVGGVAGIGDTLIAVPLDELQISPRVEQPRSGDQPRIHVDVSAEQLLEAKPEFRYEQDERTAGPV